MKHALARFLFDDIQPLLIDGRGIQPDPELAARNLVRIRDARKLLGQKWLGWNPHPPRDEAAANEDETAGSYEQYGMYN